MTPAEVLQYIFVVMLISLYVTVLYELIKLIKGR